MLETSIARGFQSHSTSLQTICVLNWLFVRATSLLGTKSENLIFCCMSITKFAQYINEGSRQLCESKTDYL